MPGLVPYAGKDPNTRQPRRGLKLKPRKPLPLTIETVHALRSKGRTIEEIARRTQSSVAEVEAFILREMRI